MPIAQIRALLLTVIALALAGCSGDGTGGGGGASEPSQSEGGQSTMPAGGDGASAAESCDKIPVPGHEGTDVRVQGTSCDQAVKVIEAAVGKGRSAYEAAGLKCEPSPAEGGDTNYTCTGDGSRVTFRYGAA